MTVGEVPDNPVNDALRRLWLSVTVCCWIIGLSLGVQVAVWAVVSFTDVRFVTVQPDHTPLTVVSADRPPAASGVPVPVEVVDEVRVKSKYDLLCRDLTSLSLAAGTLALIVLVLLASIMVIIVAAARAPGTNEAVSALIWSVIVGALTLPLGGLLDFPWQGSALRSYEIITEQVEIATATGTQFSFYAKFLLLPVVCIVGILMIGLRFGAAARKGLPDPRPYLDPELEKETAGVSPTSLHGSGRTAGAFKRVVAEKDKDKLREIEEKVKEQTGEKPVTTAGGVSAGERLRRPI